MKQTTKEKQIEHDEQARDHALYFVEDGEPEFSPARNKFIIENTIKKYEALRRKKRRMYVDSVRERADAVATYLKSRVAEGNTPVEKYFGKRWMAHLRGQQILNTVKRLYAPKHKRVNPKSRPFYLPS